MSATKKYRVSGFVTGLAIKAPCAVESAVNLTLSGEQTVNSVPVIAGDRVLVLAQTDPIEIGIYNVESSAWQRTGDFDGNNDAVNGTLVVVAVGATVTIYSLEAANPVVIGTDSLTFNLLVI